MDSDHLITSIHSWDDLDLDELAEFSFVAKQSRPETYDTECTIERERRIINWRRQFSPSFVVITRKRNKILGWLSFDLESAFILVIGRWLPVILQNKWEDQVVTSLLEKLKSHCTQINYPRIEVSFGIRDKGEKQAYKLYKKWYEANNMYFKDEISYMGRPLIENDITEIKLPESIEAKSIVEKSDAELYKCYYDAFIQSQDRMFQDQTEIERQEYFYDYYSKSKPFIEEASIVLQKHNEIIGLTLVRPRGDDAHLALLAICPNFQGKKFGGLLLRLIMKIVSQQGFKTMSLGVDTINPAMKIYQKFGFKAESHNINHCWKLKS
ncbi:MAG: GNAT family N-acetyltransferase [Candidatus Hodarchaeota archaeon]